MNAHAARFMTRALAGLCAALLLLFIVQYAGLGRGFHWSPDAAGDAARLQLAGIDKQPVKLPPASAFADIEAHPLFNADRQPTPLDASEAADAEAPASPLNVALTGVILDLRYHVRIAMLQDKASNQAIALKVGMPLDGDQASWTLIDVKPRGAVFRNAANEIAEVELETSTVAPPPPSRNPRAPKPPTPPVPPVGTAAAKGGENTAPDLAKRIEDRRRQMREDAERLRSGENAKPAPPKK